MSLKVEGEKRGKRPSWRAVTSTPFASLSLPLALCAATAPLSEINEAKRCKSSLFALSSLSLSHSLPDSDKAARKETRTQGMPKFRKIDYFCNQSAEECRCIGHLAPPFFLGARLATFSSFVHCAINKAPEVELSGAHLASGAIAALDGQRGGAERGSLSRSISRM